MEAYPAPPRTRKGVDSPEKEETFGVSTGVDKTVVAKHELTVTARDSRSCGNSRKSACKSDVPFGGESPLSSCSS